MSIHNMLYKIKSRWGIDTASIMYLLVLILVGISAFGLGRLSVETHSKSDSGILITQNKNLSNNLSYSTPSDTSQSPQSLAEKKYVASKNGKLYYTPSCSGAKRIKPANQVWFATSSDAEALGYTASQSCK